MPQDPKFDLDDLKIHFSSEDNDDSIVITIPCGCRVSIMSKARGGVRGDNEPFQFRAYCNAHFY